jgi:Uma2 family endonuclease
MTVATTPAEQRVILRNVSWEAYERLLRDHAEASGPRLFYDRGTLEIMSPSAEHEEANRTLSLLVEVIAEEFGIEVRNLGSTTFKRADLARGFEPDSCFYIANLSKVKGKKEIDLATDPPPDLVIEIDITRSSVDKMATFAALEIPEVWRYDGERLTIFGLRTGECREQPESRALPSVTSADITRFLAESERLGRLDWLRKLREWARARKGA